MLIIFFDNRGIVNNEFVLVGQAVNSAYCCDVLRRLRENIRRFRSELWRQRNWLLHHNNALSLTSFLISKFCIKDNKTVISLPTVLARHFDSTEVIEAESLALLNTLTIHDF
jgi:hypothetical protein